MEQPETFLYGYRGPWPCRNPLAPAPLPPVAVLLPDDEMRTYRRKVLRRFLRQRWTGRLSAWWHAFRNPAVEPVSDELMIQFLTDTPFSRLLNPILDPADEERFADELKGLEGCEVYKLDYSVFKDLRTLPGVYWCPAVALLKKDREGVFHPVAIALPEVVVRPTDGDAWELAKYFVLQAASQSLVSCIHPLIHFPLNPTNALAKTLLPRKHVLLQYLLPHFEIQLGLESGVLFTGRSVLHNRQDELYAPFSGETYANFVTVSRGYFGIPGNSSYPAYRYQHGVGTIRSGYGTFLEQYYQAILRTARRVLAHVLPEDPHVRRWAHHCSAYIPGFPDENAIGDPETLAATAATIICTNSICHTSDHHYYTGPSINQMPLRLRVAPPSSRQIPKLDRRALSTREDLARQHLATRMFFQPTVVTHLTDVVYQFEQPELSTVASQFQEDLRATERTMPVKRYVPLDAMASSIQF